MEDYNKIGTIFRQIRESRNISLREAAKGVLSKSQLARFEKNENQIKANNLFQLLENIGASPEEFFHVLRQFDVDDSSKLFTQLGNYEQDSNWTELKKIYDDRQSRFEETLNINFRLQSIAVKATLALHGQAENLTENEKDIVTKTLYDNMNWGMRELRLFIPTITQLSYPVVTELLDDLIKKTQYYRSIPENRRLIIMILRAATWNSLWRKDFGNSQKYKKIVKELAGSYNDYFAWIVSKGLDYSYHKEKGELKQAAQKLEEIIGIFKNLGDDYEADRNSEELQKLKQTLKK